MSNFAKTIGSFAGRALKNFTRPSRYRSNPKGIIRDNRMIRTGNKGNEQKNNEVVLERSE